MDQFAVVLFFVLVGLIGIQAVQALHHIRVLRRWQRTLLADADCAKAAVVLCLRGSDPFLRDCLQALLRQNYPRYDVHIVIDHPEDPARAALEDILRDEPTGRVHIHPLTERRETCTLKCSSVVQAVSGLDESYAFFAQLDADTVPHPNWLRELATALAADGVGAATGNRWYVPAEVSWGALVRALWNAAAVVQMHSYRIAWGGALAVRMQAVRDCRLLERWSQAFCEDTMLFRQLRSQKLRVVFVPSLMMVNREACDLAGFVRWGARQLLCARLYHPAWSAVVVHGVCSFLGPLTGLLVAILAGLTGHGHALLWVAGGLAIYESLNVLLYLWMEFCVRRIVRARGERGDWLTCGTALRLLLAIPLTQAVYPLVLLSAMGARNVAWRGVAYRIDGPWNVRLVEYRPYVPAGPRGHPNASL
jgi:cellulose synthase/poly-beta-1,6-N-acetylglucosamine synthase-like glycosyltransferase